MRSVFASLALARAEECLDETVLLQVKTKQEPMYTAGTMPPMGDYPPMGEIPPTDYSMPSAGDYPPSGDYNMSGEYPPADEYTGHTEDGSGEDMEEIAHYVADEFSLPVEAVKGFLDQMFPAVFEEFELGNEPYIEEVIMEFCMEHGGEDCQELAALGTMHIVEMFHEHQGHGQDHHVIALSECEEKSTWPYWHCDEHECYEMGDHIHLNDVHACEMAQACGPEDWDCHEQAWQSSWPVCQWPNMKTVFGAHPSGMPTVAERPDGPPDNVCLLEHHCIQNFGWDHINEFGWNEVDSCVCNQFHDVELNRDPMESWHVDYFSNYCGHMDHDHGPAMGDDMYNTAGFYTLMQRLSKFAKLGMGKQFLQQSGLARQLNPKKAIKSILGPAVDKVKKSGKTNKAKKGKVGSVVDTVAKAGKKNKAKSKKAIKKGMKNIKF